MKTEEKILTGYPSIDKPWLNQYSEEALHTSVPKKTMYELLYERNRSRLHNVAIRYYGRPSMDRPKKYQILLSKDALQDIKDIKSYILKNFKYREYVEIFSTKIKTE